MLRLALLALGAIAATVPTMLAADAPHLLTWEKLTARPRPRADATLSYGADPYQRIDLWRPAGKGPYPVVLMVHGGCWTTAIADRTLMDWIADDLRRSGIAVWNIDYRGVDRPGGGYPGTFADVGAAADLMRTKAGQYALDPTRVVAVGHSAGGHLALWLAGRGRLPVTSRLHVAHPLRIAQVVSLGGLPDLEATARAKDNGCGTAVVRRLVGRPTPAHPDVYADTSVPRLLPLGVGQDLVNGENDAIIPMRLATGYVAKGHAAGDRVLLHRMSATGHVELIAPETAAWAEAKRLILAGLGR